MGVCGVCGVCVLSTTCLCFFIAEIYLLSRKDIGKTYQDSCQATGDGALGSNTRKETRRDREK